MSNIIPRRFSHVKRIFRAQKTALAFETLGGFISVLYISGRTACDGAFFCYAHYTSLRCACQALLFCFFVTLSPRAFSLRFVAYCLVGGACVFVAFLLLIAWLVALARCYFLLCVQKKVTKEKTLTSPLPAANVRTRAHPWARHFPSFLAQKLSVSLSAG